MSFGISRTWAERRQHPHVKRLFERGADRDLVLLAYAETPWIWCLDCSFAACLCQCSQHVKDEREKENRDATAVRDSDFCPCCRSVVDDDDQCECHNED